MPLVGRAAELEILDAEIRRVAAGEFRVVLIDGAAGVGKSRLLAEAVARHQSDTTILTARSYRFGRAVSFGPWLEALDRHAGSSIDLSRSDLESRRIEVLERLVGALRTLNQERPVVVAIDDIHLSDASSWEALRYLGRRLADERVGILATARRGELRAEALATDVLLALEDDGLLRRLNVRPMNHAELGELAREALKLRDGATPAVPASLVGWLRHRSLGHPLFAISLLTALTDEGADLADPHLHRLPDSLRERVGLELESLDEDDRRLLEALAVMERRCDLSELADVLGTDGTTVAIPLERVVSSGLVVEQPLGPRFSYEIAHPLIQDAIYELIGGARRMTLHEAAATVLFARNEWGAAAGHYARSGGEGAVAALCDAMEQAERRGLYREALAVLGALLEILPAGDLRWLQVLDAMTWQAEWVVDHLAEGEVDRAVEAMRRIEPVCRDTEDLVAQATVQAHLASFLAIGAGETGAAERACRQAIHLFNEVDERNRRLLAENEMVWILSCAGDLERAVTAADRLIAETDNAVDPLVRIQAEGSGAYALGLMGRFDAAHRRFQAADSRSTAAGHRYRRIWGRVQRSLALALEGRLEEATTVVVRALREDRETAIDALVLERLANVRWLAGDLEGCVAAVDESGSRRSMHGSRRRAWAVALAARAEGEMGNTARARRHLDQAWETYGDRHILDWSAWCPWTEGLISHQAGDLAASTRHYRQAADRLAGMGAIAVEALVLVDLGYAYLDAGLSEQVEETGRRLSETAGVVGGALHPALDDLGQAMAGLAVGAVGAGDPATSARTEFSRGGYGMLAGMAAEIDARSLPPDDPAGIEKRREAAELYDAWGAVWRRDRILETLLEEGSQGRKAAGAVLGPESLTLREREVAVLAAKGHTARQIGEELFIGTRTVESHLAHLYPKLGVESKQELIVRAEELGLNG